MKPLTILLLMVLLAGITSSQGLAAPKAKKVAAEEKPNPIYIPKDLDDCFPALKKVLSPKVLKAFQKGSEDDTILYHRGLGMWIRNNWGLWGGSRLSESFNTLGIHHPDDMSGIILTSFWRHLHQQPLKVEEQVAHYQAFWAKQEDRERLEKERRVKVQARIAEQMAALTLTSAEVPLAELPLRPSTWALHVRFLAPYRDGVFLTARRAPDYSDPNTSGYYLNLATRAIHPIQVPEIETMSAAVAIGTDLWFVGKSGSEVVLIDVAPSGHQHVTLPKDHSDVPQLGTDGMSLLLVYRNAVYRREGADWNCLYRGNIELPKSGTPPRLVGDRLFLRDEGPEPPDERFGPQRTDERHLSWLTLGSSPTLTSLEQDLSNSGLNAPAWQNTFGYCVTPNGDLWAAVGATSLWTSLIRRSPEGAYQVAVAYGKLRVSAGESLFGRETPAINLLGVTPVGDGLLLAGWNGLYELRGQALAQKVAFSNTEQQIPWAEGKYHDYWAWRPTQILVLGEGRFLISGDLGGVYLLETNEAGAPQLIPLDHELYPEIVF